MWDKIHDGCTVCCCRPWKVTLMKSLAVLSTTREIQSLQVSLYAHSPKPSLYTPSSLSTHTGSKDNTCRLWRWQPDSLTIYPHHLLYYYILYILYCTHIMCTMIHSKHRSHHFCSKHYSIKRQRLAALQETMQSGRKQTFQLNLKKRKLVQAQVSLS